MNLLSREQASPPAGWLPGNIEFHTISFEKNIIMTTEEKD
jgi:hypothetical protein